MKIALGKEAEVSLSKRVPETYKTIKVFNILIILKSREECGFYIVKTS